MSEPIDADQTSAPQTRLGAAHAVRVQTPAPAAAAPLDMGEGDGMVDPIRLTTRCVTRGGEPWIPVMGEYHFSRDLPHRWDRELRKLASGGISVLATYVIWNIHEEDEGDLRWDGHRDLRRFVESAGDAGLEVMLRIGPWAHGESRNGGFPDWLQELPIRHRSDDPGYLTHVRRWFAAIAEQTRGLFRSAERPDAPIIGIQVDNELYDDGPHLATLRLLAEEAGMRASLWTATGWGGAQLPAGRVLPVYAGYADGFWEESTTGWPAFGETHFSFSTVRDDLTVGADLRDAPAAPDAPDGGEDPWPFVTCELGGGMTVAYHRRPLVEPDDVAALALTKIGSGSSWQGYYMYHGGTQAIGRVTTLQESQETGYPNDVPVRDYDFGAPIGAAGGQRRHFHLLRQQHLMMRAFGGEIAGAAATIPEPAEGAPRWAVRSDGRRGFLFVNNHQPAVAALPALDDVRFRVAFDDAAVTIPSAPAHIPSGAYAAWPLRQRLGGVAEASATAQPITEFDGPDGPVVLLAATAGVVPEIRLHDAAGAPISGASVQRDGADLLLRPNTEPGIGCEVRVGETTLVILDGAGAASVWRGDIDGRDSVVLWRGEGWFDGGFRAVRGAEPSVVDVFPPLRNASPIAGEGRVFRRYVVPGGAVEHRLEVSAFDTAPVAPVRRGGPADRLSAPTAADFAEAARVDMRVPAEALAADSAVLALDWLGDVIRVHIGDELIADQFWHGRALEVDLALYADALRSAPLTLRAFAWNPEAEVYVDPRVRPGTAAPVLEVRSAVVREVSTALLE